MPSITPESIGAICSETIADTAHAKSVGVVRSYSIAEFVQFSDDTRLFIHKGERGLSTATFNTEPGEIPTREELTASVLTAVLPDEGGEEHPYEWFVDRLRAQGVSVSADDLRRLTYRVEFD